MLVYITETISVYAHLNLDVCNIHTYAYLGTSVTRDAIETHVFMSGHKHMFASHQRSCVCHYHKLLRHFYVRLQQTTYNQNATS